MNEHRCYVWFVWLRRWAEHQLEGTVTERLEMTGLRMTTGLAGLLFAASLHASYDGTVTMSGGPNQVDVGGEFTAAANANANSVGLGTFQTFCIEDSEMIGLGPNYYYRINTGAIAGGVSGVDAVDAATGLPKDNISIGTAWLYSQFRAGTLAGYTAGLPANAGVLQDAIWMLEGEYGPTATIHAYDPTNPYLVAARAALGMTDAQLQADSNGAYGVVALNLYTSLDQNGNPTGLAQDQLGIVPEPTTMIAGALLLLPFGASTLRVLRKNRVG